MAGNTRGKLKEQFEGVHRNFEWSKTHLKNSLLLVAKHKPNLAEAITSLADGVDTLDGLAQDIYSRL